MASRCNERVGLHFATRARGYAKTQDVAALVIGELWTNPAALIDWLAVDLDQARLCIDSIRAFIQRNPWLADQLMVTSNKVTAASGARLEILAADAASAYGRRTSMLVLDEFAQWPETDNSKRLYWAMRSTLPKTQGSRLIIISNAGSPSRFSFRELEHARTHPMWRVSETPGPPPWIHADILAEQASQMPEAVYQQLFENRWVEAVGDFVDPAVLDAAFMLPGPQLRADPDYPYAYHAALDLGVVADASVLAIGHRAGNRTHLDYMRVWQGSRSNPVNLAAVGEEVFDLHSEFRFTLTVDPWQGLELAERLRARGVDVTAFHFRARSKRDLASTLLHALNTGAVALYPADGLRAELVALRVVDKGDGSFGPDPQTPAVSRAACLWRAAAAVACTVVEALAALAA
jgi:hypothetical protein